MLVVFATLDHLKIMKSKEQKQVIEQAKKIADKVNIKTTNEVLSKLSDSDFKISKRVLENIAEWCLNGDSDDEIRKKIELTPKQWGILLTVCPKIIEIMEHSRAYADIVIGGSLLQTAIGGHKIKKEQLVKVGDYKDGVKVGEHVEKHIVEEELPPNPLLLKFLAERKLNEKMGEQTQNINSYRDIIDNLSPEDRAKLENYKKVIEIDVSK